MKKKVISTSQVYSVDAQELDVFLKKVNSYLDEDGDPIAQVVLEDFDLNNEGAEIDITVDFGECHEAKENFDEWFDTESWEDFAEIPEETEF